MTPFTGGTYFAMTPPACLPNAAPALAAATTPLALVFTAPPTFLAALFMMLSCRGLGGRQGSAVHRLGTGAVGSDFFDWWPVTPWPHRPFSSCSSVRGVMNHSERALENHAEVLSRRSAQYFGTEPPE